MIHRFELMITKTRWRPLTADSYRDSSVSRRARGGGRILHSHIAVYCAVSHNHSTISIARILADRWTSSSFKYYTVARCARGPRPRYCNHLSPALALPEGGHELQVTRSSRWDVPVAHEEVEHHQVDVRLERVQPSTLLCLCLWRVLWSEVRQAREGGRRAEGDVAQHLGDTHALEVLHLPQQTRRAGPREWKAAGRCAGAAAGR